MAIKIMLVAQDEQDAPRVIGPVGSHEAAERLIEEIEAAGWTYLCQSPLDSAAAFRAEVKQGGRR